MNLFRYFIISSKATAMYSWGLAYRSWIFHEEGLLPTGLPRLDVPHKLHKYILKLGELICNGYIHIFIESPPRPNPSLDATSIVCPLM